jgi:hypothetical protein
MCLDAMRYACCCHANSGAWQRFYVGFGRLGSRRFLLLVAARGHSGDVSVRRTGRIALGLPGRSVLI